MSSVVTSASVSMQDTGYLSSLWLLVSSVTLSEWLTILTILAILANPIIVFRIARRSDAQKEAHQRKLDIFKTLMTTRADSTSWNHVNALNTIDLEFDTKITTLWHEYRNFLRDVDDMKIKGTYLWEERRKRKLNDLLYAMALVLKHDLKEACIKDPSYMPKIYSHIEDENSSIRKGVIKILNDEKSLPVHITQQSKENNVTQNN